MKKRAFKRAFGLEYGNKDLEAPIVSIRDAQISADEIVRIARRYNVPVVEKKELAAALENVELDNEIPQHLYEAVAIVLNSIEGRKESKS